MRWSSADISFRPEDHPDTKLFKRNLSFIVKIPIRRHKVAKTLIDIGASLNLMMRKTFIDMGLNSADVTPIHDTFHGIIPGQSSSPIGCINLEVSCGTGKNKCREILTFEVASFNIRYNCILGRSFLLKFMVVIHTAYAMIKMPSPKGVITLKSDQRDALAYENATLTHARRFGKKEAQDLATKMVKTHRGSTPARTTMPRPATGGTPRSPAAKKVTLVISASNQPAADQTAADEKKGVIDKEIPVDPSDADKKLRITMELEAK
jgi:hypothetical protein